MNNEINSFFNNIFNDITSKVSEETNKWEIRKIEIPITRLPEKLRYLHIIQISDLHAGPYLSYDRFMFFVNKINELNPDLVFITGDMLHESVKDLPIVIEGIKNIQSKYGIFSILGNHDHYDDYTKVVKAFKEAEQNLLIEETRIIQINGEYINIIGIDYPIIGRPVEFNYYDQIVRAKKGYKPEAISILLAHNPDAFPSSARLGIDLTLSGHTHGGQIILGEVKLFGEKVFLSPISAIHKYIKGHFQIGDKHLYVNKGLGHWFPVRINCPSEITSIRLM